MWIVWIDGSEIGIVRVRLVVDSIVFVQLLLDLRLWCATLRSRLLALEHVGEFCVSEAREAQQANDA